MEKENQVMENQLEATKKLRVYRHKSTYKGASEEDFWYTATRSDGISVKCIFKCAVLSDSMAFEISNIKGNQQRKEVIYKGEPLTNYTYFISSCVFSEIEGEDLEV